MALYAFMDAGAGFYQGAFSASSLDDALKAYDADVGLNEEIDLSLYVAEITPDQRSDLEDNYSFKGLKSDSPLHAIEWLELSDECVRSALGYPEKNNDA